MNRPTSSQRKPSTRKFHRKSTLFQNSFKSQKRNSTMRDFRLKFAEGKQREFLEVLIRNHFRTQVALSQFLGLHKHTIRGWIHERNNIPKSVFQKILDAYPLYNFFTEFIEQELPWNWGCIKGGKKRVAELEDLSAYLRYVRSFIPNRIENNEADKSFIQNSLLDELIESNVNLLSILAICLQTDGSLLKQGNSYRLVFSSFDSILVDFVKALISKLSSFNPSINVGSKGGWNVCLSDKGLGGRLLQLSPEYRTFPVDESAQPSIKFLYNKNIQTKIWAIRFAFTTDGSISLSKNNKPELNFACYNKNISEEWQRFLTPFGINGHVAKCKKSKQGVSGVRIYDFKSIHNFYKLGGFIEGVKISRKSTRYTNMEKNELLRNVIRLGVRKGVLKGVAKSLHQGGLEPPTARYLPFIENVISRVRYHCATGALQLI